MRCTYSVYNRRTDFPVIIGGTAEECADAMKISVGSFYTIYTKMKNHKIKPSKRWEIFRDDLDEQIEKGGTHTDQS